MSQFPLNGATESVATEAEGQSSAGDRRYLKKVRVCKLFTPVETCEQAFILHLAYGKAAGLYRKCLFFSSYVLAWNTTRRTVVNQST